MGILAGVGRHVVVDTWCNMLEVGVVLSIAKGCW